MQRSALSRPGSRHGTGDCRRARGAPAIAERDASAARAIRIDLSFHPQCFRSSGHFAGTDEERANAFLEAANDRGIDARLVRARRLRRGPRRRARPPPAERRPRAQKTYLGYSDAGALLAGLYTRGFQHVAHGPMPADLKRDGGEAAVKRSLAYLLIARSRRARTNRFARDADGGVQHHDPLAPHRHAVPARSCRPCADARRGVGVHVPDRPRAAAHHQQSARSAASRASGSAAAAPSRPTIPISARPKRTSRGTGARSRAFPISAAPISAMTPPTRSCRSAGFARARTPWRDIAASPAVTLL